MKLVKLSYFYDKKTKKEIHRSVQISHSHKHLTNIRMGVRVTPKKVTPKVTPKSMWDTVTKRKNSYKLLDCLMSV